MKTKPLINFNLEKRHYHDIKKFNRYNTPESRQREMRILHEEKLHKEYEKKLKKTEIKKCYKK